MADFLSLSFDFILKPLFMHIGMEFDAKGKLIVCDTLGLLSIDVETKEVEVLATKADDVLFRNSS